MKQAFKAKVRNTYARRDANDHARVLKYLNLVWGLVFVVMLFGGVIALSGTFEDWQTTGPMFVSISIAGLFFSFLGYEGDSSGRPTLKLLVYFYGSLFTSIFAFLMFFYLDSTIENNWLSLSAYAPKDYQDLSFEEAKAQFEDEIYIPYNILMWLLLLTLFLTTAAGAVLSGLVLRFRNLVQNLFMILNLTLVLGFGISKMIVASEMVHAHIFPRWFEMIDLFLSTLYVLSVMIGMAGDWSRNDVLLRIYTVFTVCVALFGLGWGMSIFALEDWIEDTVKDMSEDQKSKLADILSLDSAGEDELASQVVDTYRLYAVISLILFLVLLFMSALAFVIVRIDEAHKHILSAWAAACRKAESQGQRHKRALDGPDVSFTNVMKHGNILSPQTDSMMRAETDMLYEYEMGNRSDTSIISVVLCGGNIDDGDDGNGDEDTLKTRREKQRRATISRLHNIGYDGHVTSSKHPGQHTFRPGTWVRLVGFKTHGEMNGATAIVTGFDAKNGEYTIVVNSNGRKYEVSEKHLELAKDEEEASTGEDHDTLPIGAHVTLCNLHNNADMNGVKGVVQEVQTAKNIYTVAVNDKTFSLRRTNLFCTDRRTTTTSPVLPDGCHVRLCKLTNSPQLNGMSGIVHKFHTARARYDIVMDKTGHKYEVRRRNLLPIETK